MIEYKLGYNKVNWDQMMELYRQVDGVIGLANAGEIDIIKDSFKNSYKIVTAWDGDLLVGAGRMISDGYCYAWIHDIGVLPSYQKKGIGNGIMETLMDEKQSLLFGLTSSFTGIEFYSKLGFKKHKTAMCKYPGESDYLE